MLLQESLLPNVTIAICIRKCAFQGRDISSMVMRIFCKIDVLEVWQIKSLKYVNFVLKYFNIALLGVQMLAFVQQKICRISKHVPNSLSLKKLTVLAYIFNF